MRRKVLINLAIIGAAYVIILILVVFAPLPSEPKVFLALFLGPTLFAFGAEPHWLPFFAVLSVVGAIIWAGARSPGAGVAAAALASFIWLISAPFAFFSSAF